MITCIELLALIGQLIICAAMRTTWFPGLVKSLSLRSNSGKDKEEEEPKAKPKSDLENNAYDSTPSMGNEDEAKRKESLENAMPLNEL